LFLGFFSRSSHRHIITPSKEGRDDRDDLSNEIFTGDRHGKS